MLNTQTLLSEWPEKIIFQNTLEWWLSKWLIHFYETRHPITAIKLKQDIQNETKKNITKTLI